MIWPSTLVGPAHDWRVTEDDFARATAEPVRAQDGSGANKTQEHVVTAIEAAHKKQENPGITRVLTSVQLPGEDSNLE
jgi:hypothetical protein